MVRNYWGGANCIKVYLSVGVYSALHYNIECTLSVETNFNPLYNVQFRNFR